MMRALPWMPTEHAKATSWKIFPMLYSALCDNNYVDTRC